MCKDIITMDITCKDVCHKILDRTKKYKSARTASATGHHLQTIQVIVENVYVWLVGPRRLCLNFEGANYKSSYLLTNIQTSPVIATQLPTTSKHHKDNRV